VEACRRCSKCLGAVGGEVVCSPSPRFAPSRAPERAPISEVMDKEVVCVDADATAQTVEETMAQRDAPLAVVLDAGGRPIGVCSRADLAQRSPLRRVQTCMTPFVITMLDGTTVADAIDLILDRDLRHVPVLAEGRVVGLVTPRAVIRWLAQNVRARRNPRRLGAARTRAAE
jgi:CBS domain-containing protein